MLRHLPPPKSQGLNSLTFKQPPLDFSLNFPEIIEWHGEHSAEHPLFRFSEGSGGVNTDTCRTICWKEAVRGFRRASAYIRNVVDGHGVAGCERRVIAILSSSESISYHSTLVGILRLNYITFPISPRNSPAAVASLLSRTGATELLVSSEPALSELADAAIAQLESDVDVKIHAMPTFEALYSEGRVELDSIEVDGIAPIDLDSTAMIYHSSGTTSFPKPIYFTHRFLVIQASFMCFGEVDLAGVSFAGHGVPYFHGMSLFFFVYGVGTGLICSVFKPHTPATVPNPVNVFENAVATGCDYIFVAPTFIESWAKVPEYVERLSKFRGVITGGGPLSNDVGDFMVSRNVKIITLYASTEALMLSLTMPAKAIPDWQYMRLAPNREFRFVDHGDNEFELIVMTNEYFRPNVINTTIDGREGYATHDLFTPHPTKEGYWRIIGRTDDQIMHSTGEKTNPGPLEAMLARDPHIQGAIYFGRERFFCGVIVQPKSEFAFEPAKDSNRLAEFRDLVWPMFERVNDFAPTHSRIFKEMILVASPDRPLLFTIKGTLRRQATLDQYKDEIDAAYAAAEASAQEGLVAPSEWTPETIKELVRQAVEKTMRKDISQVDDDIDLFDWGLDSLQATWIRNSLVKILQQKDKTIPGKLSANFVYDNPTIGRLAKLLASAVLTVHDNGTDEREQKKKRLLELVDKYGSSFTATSGACMNGNYSSNIEDVVLLTGSSGSFGSNILAKFIASPQVSRIYALSRASPKGVRERHETAFTREGLDVELLKSEKVKFLYGDPSYVDFNLDKSSYEEMKNTVTHIVHNGWRVNFNLSVNSFESNIRSVRTLVDFSLSQETPSRVIFISSIGVLQNTNEEGPARELLHDDPEIALGIGYSESKWVSEQILKRAMAQTPLRATIVRCGQLTGGPSGSYNEHEWFPSVVKSSIKLQKLPNASGKVTWITGYNAASALLDILHEDSEPILHLTHPIPIPWTTIMQMFATELNIPIVSYEEWLGDLREAHAVLNSWALTPTEVETALQEHPALRLMDFFEASASTVNREDVEPLGVPRLDVSKAIKAAPALNEAEQVGCRHIRRWLKFWKKSGFLS